MDAPSSSAAPAVTPEAAAPQPGGQQTGGNTLTLADVRRLWPDIVEATKLRRRVTWIHLTQNAQVVAVDAKTLTLGFSNAGARDNFASGGSLEIVRQAAIDVVGADWQVEAIVDPGARADVPPPRPTQQSPSAPPAGDMPAPDRPPPVPPSSGAGSPDAEPSRPGTPQGPPPQPQAVAAARGAIQQTRQVGAEPEQPQHLAQADADVDRDDPEADTGGLAGAELLQRELGAQVIAEIPHQ
jgi:DNA polymerase-3 subunit gamma/tau